MSRSAQGTSGTEARNPASVALSEMSVEEIIALMTREESRALDAITAATRQLSDAAQRVADVYISGGQTVFLGAGTSGRLAVMEVAELPPTFGVEPDRFVALGAGGATMGPAAITQSEDDVDAAPAALSRLGVGPGDAVIGLAASGTTPFVVAGLRAAGRVGAWTCGISNNQETPLLAMTDCGILLDTGPEILTGSTRLKAGTAQKLALNRITTAALVRGGMVQSNLMIGAAGVNEKLRVRCVHTVMELTGANEAGATSALEASSWRPALAIQQIGAR